MQQKYVKEVIFSVIDCMGKVSGFKMIVFFRFMLYRDLLSFCIRLGEIQKLQHDFNFKLGEKTMWCILYGYHHSVFLFFLFLLPIFFHLFTFHFHLLRMFVFPPQIEIITLSGAKSCPHSIYQVLVWF